MVLFGGGTNPAGPVCSCRCAASEPHYIAMNVWTPKLSTNQLYTSSRDQLIFCLIDNCKNVAFGGCLTQHGSALLLYDRHVTGCISVSEVNVPSGSGSEHVVWRVHVGFARPHPAGCRACVPVCHPQTQWCCSQQPQ